MVLLSEVLGRKLVGKYILPTTKEKMEDRDKKNENSKNPFLKIEKLLGSKKTTAKAAEKTETTQQTTQQAAPAAIKPQQTAFSGKQQ
jgi:hypothetical protein